MQYSDISIDETFTLYFVFRKIAKKDLIEAVR